LQPGDTVTFIRSGASAGTIDVTGFSSVLWTNISDITLTSGSPSSVKTVLASPVQGQVDVILIAKSATPADNVDIFAIYPFLQPYKNIALLNNDYTIEVNNVATSHAIGLYQNDGTTQTNTSTSADTLYRVRNGANGQGTLVASATRTGLGDITVNSVPDEIGGINLYEIEANLPIADGGEGVWITCNLNRDNDLDYYQVKVTGTLDASDPLQTDYGMAIYDNTGELVSSFSDGSSILRLVKTGTVTTSTTGTVDFDTGVQGVNRLNGLVQLSGISITNNEDTSQHSVNLSAQIISNSNVSNTIVRIGRDTSARTIEVNLLQWKGLSINT
jgi:hypothetical protein